MKLVRLLIIIISRSGLKLGHVGSETRSLGQIFEKPCVHSRGHSFNPKFIKLCQTVNHHNIWVVLGQKLGRKVKSEKNLVYTLEGTV